MEGRISGIKHLVIYLLIAAVGIAALYLYRKPIINSITTNLGISHQFIGQVIEKHNDIIVASGEALKGSDPTAYDPQHRENFTITVNSNTKFVKTIWQGGKPPQKGEGSIKDMVSGVSILVKSATNIAKTQIFTAQEIDYEVRIK